MRHLVPLFPILAACGTPPPTCAAAAEAYDICANDQVWTCPVAAADKLAEKQALDEACELEPDPIACVFDTEYEQFDMVLSADCKAAGQVCVSDPLAADFAASCEDP